MNRTRLPALAALAALACCAVAARGDKLPEAAKEVFDKPDKVVLYSLEPKKETEKDKGFNGWKVLGSTEVKDKEGDRPKLLAAFQKGVEENKGLVANCFIPRHGLRVTKGDKTVDLVICFECLQVHTYVNGKQGDSCLVTKTPQEEFNRVLKAAGIKLAE